MFPLYMKVGACHLMASVTAGSPLIYVGIPVFHKPVPSASRTGGRLTGHRQLIVAAAGQRNRRRRRL